MTTYKEEITIQSSSKALLPLTGVRYIAALMVFVSHYRIPVKSDLLFRIASSGYVGVTFFFILSGFILTYNYFNKLKVINLKFYAQYIFARIARIYPLYIFCLLFAWLQSGCNTTHISKYIFALQAWSSKIFIAYGVNGPAWSISVEFFLYLCLPFLIISIVKIRMDKKIHLLGIGIFVVAFLIFSLATYFALSGRGGLDFSDPKSSHRWLYRMPFTRLLDFTLGTLAAILFINFKKSILFLRHRYWIYLNLLVILLLASSEKLYLSSFSWDAAYAIPFTFLILICALNPISTITKFLSSKLMLLLGEASFAFYLVHMLLANLYTHPAPSFKAVCFYLMFLIFTTCTAIGLHLSIEKPGRILINRGLKKILTASYKIKFF